MCRIVLTAAMVMSLVVLLAACGENGESIASEFAPQTTAGNFPVDVASQDAKMHIGKLAKLCGPIVEHRINPEGLSGTFLFFDYKFPNYTSYILIEDANRGNFPENLESLYVGKQACVSGTIQDRLARHMNQKIQPHILITDPAAIDILP